VNSVVSSKTSTAELNHITIPQSGQGGDREINTDVSWLNQNGGGGTDFRDRSDVKDGKSNQSQVVDICESFMMKTKLTVLCTRNSMFSCDHAFCTKIYNGS